MTRSYTFTAQCASGQWKTFTFNATGYKDARKKLDEYIANN